ncbi:Alcohol dehydrogenase [Cordyceps militaris]|uniref:Alcohol dehydrogenase n=1 Tax=Cordyceps militaris TaxID=73501 RepID=A0A2H4SS66_CORMI|nr:Alcohol dehydrogenase [Cordyceps militaris]
MALNRDENEAAWLMGTGEPLKVGAIQNWTPGPGEIRVRNEVISLNPIEAKLQFNMFQLPYPAVLGFTYAGTVTDIGPDVTSVARGDRVAVARWGATAREDRFGAFQKYPLALERNVLRLGDASSLEDGAGVIANLATAVSALTIHMGLDRPATPSGGGGGRIDKNGKRILIYGGSTAIGGLAVKYASDAGYEVVTTSSAANEALVRRRNPTHVVDHNQAPEDVVQALRSYGPYDGILEATGSEAGTALMGRLLGASGGGLFFSTSPSPNDDALPAGVAKRWSSYSEDLVSDPARGALRDWFVGEYLPRGVQTGAVWPNPASRVPGGLSGLQDALDRLREGKVSGVKLVVYPQE